MRRTQLQTLHNHRDLCLRTVGHIAAKSVRRLTWSWTSILLAWKPQLPAPDDCSLGPGLALVCSTLVRHPYSCHQRHYCELDHAFMRNVGTLGSYTRLENSCSVDDSVNAAVVMLLRQSIKR